MLKTAVKVFIVFTICFAQNPCFAQFSSISAVSPNSESNFLPNSFFSSFPNIFSSLSAASDNFEQPTLNLPPVKNFSPSVSSTSVSSGSSSQPQQQFTNSSSLETFISTFTKAVQSSSVLSDVCDLTQTSLQSFEDFLHNTIHNLPMSLGISDSQEIHSYATMPIMENFEVLTCPVLSKIGANAMGKLLLAEGILNDMNAASLASVFADVHETSAKLTVDKNFQESKFPALADGSFGFLKAQGLLTTEKVLAAVKYFSEEIRIAGKQFGRKSMS